MTNSLQVKLTVPWLNVDNRIRCRQVRNRMRLIIQIVIVYTALAILSFCGYVLSRDTSKDSLAFKFVLAFWFCVALLFCSGNFPFLFLKANIDNKSIFQAYYGCIELSIGLPVLGVSLFYMARRQLWPTIFFKTLCWLVIALFTLTIVGTTQYLNGFPLHLLVNWRFAVLFYLILTVYLSCSLMIKTLGDIEIFATGKGN